MDKYPNDTVGQRVKLILIQVIPASFGLLSHMFIELINVSFIGHLNNAAMISGVGLGNMTVNLIGASILIGFNSALDTLIS